MVLILIFPEIPRVRGAYEKSKKRGSFHKHHGAHKKMSVLAQLPFLWLTVSITSPPLKKRVYKRVCNYHRFLV